LMLTLLFVLAVAKEPKAKNEAPKAKAESCDSTLKELAQLKAQLEVVQKENAELKVQKNAELKVQKESAELKYQAVQKENAELKKQVADSSDLSFVSTQHIVDAFGSVTDAAMSQGGLDSLDLTPVYSAANASYGFLWTSTEQATAAASTGLAAATDAFNSGLATAQDLHTAHAAQHTQEYYKAATDAYTEHAEVHVETARKAYYDSVHPHVDVASKTISDGYGAALEHSGKLGPHVMTVFEMVKTSLLQASNGQLGKQLGFLTEPQTYTVLGRTFKFNSGFLDIGLAFVQGLVAAYLVFKIGGQFLLSTIIWKIGVQLLGKKVFIGCFQTLIKVCYKGTRLVLSICFTLVFLVVTISFSWIMLAICSGLGVALLHAVERNLAVGLSPKIRLAAGAGVGFVFYLLCRVTCCKKRKAKPEAHTNGKNGKKAPEAKKATAASPKTDAKQATKPAKKK